jgi:DNA-directed RNA polymerase subunit M/transcription elongation factor TFIIS
MPIENRNLTPGTKLIGKYHKQTYHADVIEGEDKKLKYKLEDGREFKSPSGAGMAVTGHPCDGWKFWNVETPETANLEEENEDQPESTAEAVVENAQPAVTEVAEEPSTAEKKAKIIYRLPNQKGVPEGKTRWYCKECGESFLVDAGILPKTCPAGHTNS